MKCPPIDDELVAYLDHVFPERAVNPDKENPHRAFGRAEVVRHLKQVKKLQEEAPDVWS